MRKVGTVESQLEANAFIAGMHKLQMEVVAEKERHGWELWALDEDRIDEARAKLPEFLAANATKEQLQAFVHKARPEPSKPEAGKPDRPKPGAGKGRSAKPLTLFYRAPVTISLIVGCLVVAVLSNFGKNNEVVGALVMGGGGHYKAVLRSGQIWRLITPIFVHFGFFHILFNIWWLRDLGVMLERALGSLKVTLMVVGIAVASNLLENMLASPLAIAGGMSGVVFGLCAYSWVRGRLDLTSGVFVPDQTAIMIGIFFLLCWMGLFGSIANVTHTVGLLVGLAWGYMDSMRVGRR